MATFGLVSYELRKRFQLYTAWKIVILSCVLCLAWGGWWIGNFTLTTYNVIAGYFEPGAPSIATPPRPAQVTKKAEPAPPNPDPLAGLSDTELRAKYANWDQRLSSCMKWQGVEARDGKCREHEIVHFRDPFKNGGAWICKQDLYAPWYEYNGAWSCNIREYKRRREIECGLRYEKKAGGLWCQYVSGRHRNRAYLRQDWRMGNPTLRKKFKREIDVR